MHDVRHGLLLFCFLPLLTRQLLKCLGLLAPLVLQDMSLVEHDELPLHPVENLVPLMVTIGFER